MQIIDLSQGLDNSCVVFPTLPPVDIRPAVHQGQAKLVSLISMNDHSGTHIDALGHFREGGPTAEQIPLEYCYGDGIVLDVSQKRSGESVNPSDVKEAAQRVGVEIRPLDIVCFRTGADRYWGKQEYARYGVNITPDTVRWLVLEKGVKVFGVDAISIEITPPYPAHRLVEEFEYYHIESLTNLDKIPVPRFKFVGLPLKLIGASAGPMRAVAIVE